MQPLLTASQMRAADRAAIKEFQLPEIILMEHAALAVADSIEGRFGALLPKSRGVVVAGPGNNGGDAIAAARILRERGCMNLEVVLTAHGPLSQSTELQLKIWECLGGTCSRELTADKLAACDWILDGLLGTGLARPVEGNVKRTIDAINTMAGRKWILAIDIPSGLSADTGNPQGAAVQSSETITFGFLKRGLFTGQASDFTGPVRVVPIQIPRTAASHDWNCLLYGEEDTCSLPKRPPTSHKGMFGHVGIVAGPEEKQGAAALASLGALRCGAGLATVAADPATIDSLRPRLAREVMTQPLSAKFFEPRYQAIVIGPGLGVTQASWLFVQMALQSQAALVLDADALTLMGKNAAAAKSLLARRREQGLSTVLTPHPKEASRLSGGDVETIQTDRFLAAEQLALEWASTVLLKGRGTVIATVHQPTIVVCAGDAGLAKGGTGDILSGMIGSFLAQRLVPMQAVPLAAFVHGRASERLSQLYGQTRSSLASEIAEQVPWVLRELEGRGPEIPTVEKSAE